VCERVYEFWMLIVLFVQDSLKQVFMFRYSGKEFGQDLIYSLNLKKMEGFVDKSDSYRNVVLTTAKQTRASSIMSVLETFNGIRSRDEDRIVIRPYPFEDEIMTVSRKAGETLHRHWFYKRVMQEKAAGDLGDSSTFYSWEAAASRGGASNNLDKTLKNLRIDMVDAVPVAKSRDDASADGGAAGAASSSSLSKGPAAPGRAAPLVGRVLGEPRKVNGRSLSPIQRLAEAARRPEEAGAPSGVSAGRVKRVAHRIVPGGERRPEQGNPLVQELGQKRLRVEELERELEVAARKLRAQRRFSAHQLKCFERQSEGRGKELEAAKRELGEMRSKYEAVRDELGEKINELDEKDGDARAARRLLEWKDEELEQARHAVEELQQELAAAGHSSDRLAESNQALEELRREQALLHGHLSDTSANQAVTLVRLAESHAHTTMAVQGNMRLMEIVGARLGAAPAALP